MPKPSTAAGRSSCRRQARGERRAECGRLWLRPVGAEPAARTIAALPSVKGAGLFADWARPHGEHEGIWLFRSLPSAILFILFILSSHSPAPKGKRTG